MAFSVVSPAFQSGLPLGWPCSSFFKDGRVFWRASCENVHMRSFHTDFAPIYREALGLRSGFKVGRCVARPRSFFGLLGFQAWNPIETTPNPALLLGGRGGTFLPCIGLLFPELLTLYIPLPLVFLI